MVDKVSEGLIAVNKANNSVRALSDVDEAVGKDFNIDLLQAAFLLRAAQETLERALDGLKRR